MPKETEKAVEKAVEKEEKKETTDKGNKIKIKAVISTEGLKQAFRVPSRELILYNLKFYNGKICRITKFFLCS